MLLAILIKLCGNVSFGRRFSTRVIIKGNAKYKNFRGDCKFSTYLIQIATNCYKNEVRKQQRMIYDEEALRHLEC